MYAFAILAVLLAGTSAELTASCTKDPGCAGFGGRNAIGALLSTLQDADTALANMSYASNETIGTYWDAVWNTDENLSGDDLKADRNTVRVWSAQFERTNSTTLQHAIEALQAMQKAKCVGCARVSLDPRKKADDPIAPIFSVRAVESRKTSAAARPDAIPAQCSLIDLGKTPWPAHFCPANVTSDPCPQIVGSDCQIGTHMWPKPVPIAMAPSDLPNGTLQLQAVIRQMTIFLTRENHNSSEVVPVIGQDDRNSPAYQLVPISWSRGTSTTLGFWKFWMYEAMALSEFQAGLNYVAYSMQNVTSGRLSGAINNADGKRVGVYSIQTSAPGDYRSP